MKHIVTILILISAARTFGGESASDLEKIVNTNWTNSNYAAIIAAVDAALTRDPHDLFALCLRHGYYMNVDEDFDKAKASSTALVTEVDGRIQNASGAVYDLAKAISVMARPKTVPPQQPINQKRMAFRHKQHPKAFPFIGQYRWFADNLEEYGDVKETPPQPDPGS